MFVQQMDSVNMDTRPGRSRSCSSGGANQITMLFKHLRPIVEHELLMDGKRGL
jgi:hypothetical protein